MVEDRIEDIIIIGSGPAGHTAAIYTARAELQPLMFEGFSSGGLAGGQLMTTTEVENFPGFPEGITGPELMDAMRLQSARFGTRIEGVDVSAVDLSEQPFKVTVDERIHRSRALIIATGASARYLGLPSEQRLLNHGVSACATCDGSLPLFRNRVVMVVGGGDTAMEEALFLTRFASQVILLHRKDTFRASKIMLERCRQHPKIVFKTPFVVADLLGDKQLEAVRIASPEGGTASEETIPVAGIFIAIGHTPNTALFTGQLELDELGYIRTRKGSARTSVEGVFACGDVQDHIYRQAVTAAGSGCQAAIEAERWLPGQALPAAV